MGAGYRMAARAKGEAEVLIYEDVGGWFGGVTAKDFYADLRALGSVETLNVRINSMGGEVFEGLAIYRHLAEHKATKIVHVDGIAASIASIIAMAGSEIRVAEAGRMMIHDAAGLAWGTAAAVREIADRLESITGSLTDIYVARTGIAREKLRTWMEAETWFTAQEAVNAGLATHVAENIRVAACGFDPVKHRHIRNAPRDLPTALTSRPERDAFAARLAAQRSRLTSAASTA
jgi:ATP-dependent Clp protease, protease subunit